MNDRTEHLTSTAYIPEDERWVHEPEFRKRFEWADRWMQHYIPTYPYRVGDNWVVFNKNFQCEMHTQSESSQAAIFKSLKKVVATDWASVSLDGDLECKELVSLPGYFKIRLTPKHQVVVGSDGNRALFLTLHSEERTEEFIVDPAIWDEVTSFSLQHNHDFSPPLSAAIFKARRESCPRCKLAAREQADLYRLATPLYAEMLSSIPFYKDWGADPDSWSNYIGSRIVAAQHLVAQRCGVFVPLQCHEKPDAEIQQYLSAWQTANPGKTPDISKGE